MTRGARLPTFGSVKKSTMQLPPIHRHASAHVATVSRMGILAGARAAAVIMVIGMLALAPAASATNSVRRGPPGKAFYTAPKKLVPGRHGTVIWARGLRNDAALPAAKRNVLVLYRSRDRTRAPVAVSGSIAVPRGQPPRGGWPVLSWAYGVVGLADRCAPTREGPRYPYRDYLASVEPTLNGWLRAGYAVIRTDYAGLGTSGIYDYLVGVPTARSVLDMVRAAREVDSSLGRRFVSAGHSSGGHAALWAGGRAATWTPELRLRGIVAYAPSSHVDRWWPAGPALKSPSPASVFHALATRAFDDAYSKLRVSRELGDRFRRDLYPQTLTECVSELWQDLDWMALAPADIFHPGADLTPYVPTLSRNEPTEAGVAGHVLLAQGTNDVYVFPVWTEDVADQLQASGAKVDYRAYDSTHNGVLAAARRDVNAWIRGRLSR